VRPLRLRLKGFTSFRDEQEIDFVDLDLFAIWGPTGSGKSSLLDAMTYALYGEVDRVGQSAAQLISQGQPRLSVLLDFEVDGRPYRINRSTQASGTKVLLEKQNDDGEWASYDEGADKVRGVKGHVQELIGLDYTAFTRSVVLPQGKFAEFMAGEAQKRREILTDLLGLELFGRMARRAGDIASKAKLEADAKDEVVEREYAGIDEAALLDARARAEQSELRRREIIGAVDAVEKITARWEAAAVEAQKTSGCAQEFRALAQSVRDRAAGAVALAGRAEAAGAELAAAVAAVEEAARRRGEAARIWEETIRRVGRRDALIAARGVVEPLRAAERAAAEAAESGRAAEAKRVELVEKKAATAAAVAAAKTLETKAASALAAAEAAYHAAHRADLVGALVHDLSPGAPCPVCERPLEALPEIDSEVLERADRDRREARRAESAATRAVADAHQGAALLEREIETAAADVKRCADESARRADEATRMRNSLVEAFGGDVPDDPAPEIVRRLQELDKVEDAARAAEAAHGLAEKTLGAEEKAAANVSAEAAAIAAALQALDVAGATARALAAGAEVDDPGGLDDLPADVADIAAAAQGFAERLDAVTENLERQARERRAELPELVAEARAAVPPWLPVEAVEPSPLLKEMRVHSQSSAADAARASDDARRIEGRLENLRKLTTEIDDARKRHSTYRALATELKADRLIAFLQGEALRLLAAAGSERLSYLSNERYRLSFENDEFYVIDSWNGEDRRSVRTLSGGETFLASLALALALSEQVRILAVGERAKLDSLFLDEGFGTLDAETLETVVSAIEQLGGDDRTVGVITHVADLAERLPARLIVTKSPRGSTVEREPA
jgi:DNA repair protein SbcC/Rad50